MSLIPNPHPYVLAQLLTEGVYRIDDSQILIQNSTEQSVEPQKTSKNIQEDVVPDYLGENNRFILIVTHYADSQYLPDEEKAFLLSILKAIKLSIDDVAIINHARYPKSTFETLKTFFACTNALLFGVKPESLGVSGLPYQTNKVGACKLIAADSLKEIMNGTDKKKLLWTTLKSNFNV